MAGTAAANQAYFNRLAPVYEVKFRKSLRRLEKELRDRVSGFIRVPEGGRLLDYACGTGLLSRALGDQLRQCVGVDVSESMVEAYNATARDQDLWPEQRAAHVGNLVDPADPWPHAFSSPRFFDFDIAGVGAGFHHFDDCHLAAQRLAQRLRSGGVLVVVDFVSHAAHPGHGGGAGAGVRHHGFSEAQMRDIFEGAGVGAGFEYGELDEDFVFEEGLGDGEDMVRRVFLARGEKA